MDLVGEGDFMSPSAGTNHPAGKSPDLSASLGGLAQVVEQPVHTRYVPGSNPGTATPAPSRLPATERQAAVARVRRAVATAVDRRGILAPGEVILIGCSGGPDSTTLLDALARLAPARGWRLAVAHVDHGLRAESAAEASRVADFAEARDLPFRAITTVVAPGPSLQDRARDARAAALRAVAGEVGATAIALGHTADDQAETVLMRALAGATPRALAAMAERNGLVARPLLRIWRGDIVAYCAALELATVDDPSNSDPRFLRSRVRHELLPALEAVFPAARRRLCVLADHQRRFIDG
jgi:tRNA(Ile)-lysidine synthase